MATIHISRAEASTDLDALLARISNGDEVMIEENEGPIALLRPVVNPPVRLLSETLRILQERGSNVTLDGEFEKDLTDAINSHREPLFDPLNDPWT